MGFVAVSLYRYSSTPVIPGAGTFSRQLRQWGLAVLATNQQPPRKLTTPLSRHILTQTQQANGQRLSISGMLLSSQTKQGCQGWKLACSAARAADR